MRAAHAGWERGGLQCNEQTARAGRQLAPVPAHVARPSQRGGRRSRREASVHALATEELVSFAGLLRGLLDQCAIEVAARAGHLLEGVPNVYGPPGQSQTVCHETPSE